MKNIVTLPENECDSSVHTYVNLGKKIKDVPSGWALNIHDIREFIPVLRYEFECYLIISNIISPCRIRINPRLFYYGTPLKEYLRSQKLLDKNKKIHLEIKFNRQKLIKELSTFSRQNLNYIDTKLLVGKSFRSKGWGLSKEVKSKIFPLSAYNYMYPVYIDGIPSKTKLNIQIRLFYSSNELSQMLEKLSKKNLKEKVEARIIINEEYLNLTKSLINNHLSNRKCIICGKYIDEETKGDKCFECLDKELTVLKLKSILENINNHNSFYEEDLLKIGFNIGKIKITLSKLEKYGLISRDWDEKYKLKDKSTIENFINKWS